MGTSRSSIELSRKFNQLATEVERRQAAASRAGATVIVKSVKPRVLAATGGDLVLSGTTRTTGKRVKRSGLAKKIDVRLKNEIRGGSPQSFVYMTGPAQLVENDVQPHFVYSRHARAEGISRISRSYVVTDLTGAPVRNSRGRAKRVRVDTRAAAKMFGGHILADRRAVLNIGNGEYRKFTVAKSLGRQPWRKGVDESRSAAIAVMRRTESGAITQVFQ